MEMPTVSDLPAIFLILLVLSLFAWGVGYGFYFLFRDRGNGFWGSACAAAVVTCFLPYAVYQHLLWRQALEHFPAGIDITGMTDHGSAMDGICGASVLRLSHRDSIRLHKEGLVALANLQEVRGPDKRVFFKGWYETPPKKDPNPQAEFELLEGGFIGIGCAHFAHALQQSIDSALSQPGSFYAPGTGWVIVVMPDSDLAVFSYFEP